MSKNLNSSPLAQRRHRRGLVQEDLARRIGKKRTHVADIERGRFLPSLPTAVLLAHGLGCTVDDICADLGLSAEGLLPHPGEGAA